MSSTGTRARPDWARALRDVDEDPTRFLLSWEAAPRLVAARIRGIDDVDTALMWIYAEQRLAHDTRPKVIALLNERIKDLRAAPPRAGPRAPAEPKEVVYLEYEYDDEGEIVDEHRHTPEEWHSRSASAKVARMREDG